MAPRNNFGRRVALALLLGGIGTGAMLMRKGEEKIDGGKKLPKLELIGTSIGHDSKEDFDFFDKVADEEEKLGGIDAITEESAPGTPRNKMLETHKRLYAQRRGLRLKPGDKVDVDTNGPQFSHISLVDKMVLRQIFKRDAPAILLEDYAPKQEQRLLGMAKEFSISYESAIQKLKNGAYEKAMRHLRDAIGKFVAYHAEREEHIVGQLKTGLLERLLKEYPLLREKKVIRVLVNLGYNHDHAYNLAGLPGRVHYLKDPLLDQHPATPRKYENGMWTSRLGPNLGEEELLRFAVITETQKHSMPGLSTLQNGYFLAVTNSLSKEKMKSALLGTQLTAGAMDVLFKTSGAPGLNASEKQMRDFLQKKFGKPADELLGPKVVSLNEKK